MHGTKRRSTPCDASAWSRVTGPRRPSTAALEKERAEALELERQAEEAERQAGALRDEAASLDAPDEAELGRLRAAEEESRIAAAKLSVGLTAELTVEAAIEATVDADGNVRTLTPQPGTPVELEATRELAVELPGVATLRVRGGGRDLKEQADAAEARWQAASGPVFGRTGCSSLEELVAQRRRAEDLRSQADELMREAEADALRAEGRNVIEQRLATARAERDKYAGDLGEYLEAGQTVDELAATFDDPLDEAALGTEIDSLQAGLHERRSLSEQMGVRIEGDERALAGERARLKEQEAQFAERSAALEDWQAVLESAGEERGRLERELAAVDAELKALRTEAADEVEEARAILEGLTETQTEQQRAHEGLRIGARRGAHGTGPTGGRDAASARGCGRPRS